MEERKFVEVYHDEEKLLKKIAELQALGFSDEDIYVVVKDADDITMVKRRTDVDIETAHDSWGDKFAAYLLGDEPVRRALLHTGMTDAEADEYYTHINNGGMLLYVNKDYAAGLGNENEPVAETTGMNISENPVSASAGRSTGVDLTEDRFTDTNTSSADDDQTLRLHEERLSVNKDRVQTGEVQVEKEVVEEQQVIDVPVEREEVTVERRPVKGSEFAEDTPKAFGDRAFEESDDTIRVPITEEQIEVTKKPVVTEEIVIEKNTVQDTETVRDTVRREKAHIEKEGNIVREDEDLK